MITKSQPLDVAIIGAGPYGLSIAAHLYAVGIEYRVFGTPMESWQRHMPEGMRLKSYGESSNLFDADAAFSLEAFARAQGIDYHPSRRPVELATFVAYGQAFQERFVPRVTAARLLSLTAGPRSHHELSFDNGETLSARHVVVAVGTQPFKHTPAALTHLPANLVSHSSDYGSLAGLLRKRIIVVGSGASALDLAALLSAQGSAVTLVTRSPALHFQSRPGSERSLLQRVAAPSAHGLGAGWLLRACAVPQLIHTLPDRVRSKILSDVLGPSGGYFLREQIEMSVGLKLGRVVEQIDELGGRVLVKTVDLSGTRETMVGDHVVAATGYRVDVRRLDFLHADIQLKLRTLQHAPVLSGNFESSVPGLYFVGLTSAPCFGPVMRFVVGAVHPARRLSRMLPKRLTSRRVWISSPVSD